MTVSDLFKELVDLIDDGQGGLPLYMEGKKDINSIVEKSTNPTPDDSDYEFWFELSDEEN